VEEKLQAEKGERGGGKMNKQSGNYVYHLQ
jgi:hypothetical protein